MTPRGYRAASAAALGLAGVAVLLRHAVVRVTVRGSSMEPVYEDGTRVLVHRGGSITVGRVVVLADHSPRGSGRPAAVDHAVPDGRWIIKRVAAVPGDPAPLDRVPGLDPAAGPLVPPGRLVLLGDNPEHSYDSRHAGYFAVERVLGTVVGGRTPPPRPRSQRQRGRTPEAVPESTQRVARTRRARRLWRPWGRRVTQVLNRPPPPRSSSRPCGTSRSGRA
ncbi:S26 family signal peptidase [Streptomyces alboflavus]|uniref:S26 family signal peptidase n=1 Tax=Streptomyces alboflavus TaxID=67267 RepID=UPI000B428CF1|nr:S26 family signal peptidase [Streptomyces alboflavus]